MFLRVLPWAALLSLLPAAASAESTLFVSHYNGNLYTLTLSDSRALSISSQVSSGAGMPAWITLDFEGKKLYVPDEAGRGAPKMGQFSIGAGGKLTMTGQVQTPGGELHSDLYGGSDGKGFIAAAEYDAGAIVTYKLPLSASAQRVQQLKFTLATPGPNRQRQTSPHPHSTFPDPSGKYLLSADLGADLIRIFTINANTGTLTECPSAKANAGDGPRHGAFWSPSDASDTNINYLYTVNELSNSVSAWKVTYPSSGCLTLTLAQTLSTFGTAGAKSGSKASEVHVRDNFLYAANRNDKSFGAEADSLALFEIAPATGQIKFVETANARAFYPRTFSINGKGDMVAVGGQTSSNVAILERNVTSGRIGGLIANLQVANRGTPGNEDGLSAVIWNE